MRRSRLLLLAFLVVLAASSVAAVSASAEPSVTCKEEGTSKALTEACIQLGAEGGSGTLLVLGLPGLETLLILGKRETGTPSVLESGSGIRIECSEATAEGLADGSPTESAKVEHGEVKFTGCRVASDEEHCEVKEGTIKSELMKGLPLPKEPEHIEFTPLTGTIFAEIHMISKAGKTCASASVFKVTGEELCLVTEVGTDKVTHLITCTEESQLETNGEKVKVFELTEEVHLDRPSTWGTGFNAEPPWSLLATETIS